MFSLPLSALDGSSNNGSGGSDTLEASPSPTSSFNESTAAETAMRLSPSDPDLQWQILDLLQGEIQREIPDEICPSFNNTPEGPGFTCRLYKGTGEPCLEYFCRRDRFKHHLQTHIGLTPYKCDDSPRVIRGQECGRLFSSIAARDTHVKNKGVVTCDCEKSFLPKNRARHQRNCPVYQARHRETDIAPPNL